MQEVVTKAVTEAIIGLKLGEIIERVDRRISTLTDKIDVLEARQQNNQDVNLVWASNLTWTALQVS